jgi:beta-catenin-like protein 1
MDEDEREEMADEWFSRRLDAGLFCLQTIDVILAWLIAEDDGARKKIQALLADRDETFAVIRETIQEQIDGIDAESEESKETREMLTTLVQFLQ